MDDLNRFSAIYTDELRLSHDEATRTRRPSRPRRRPTRNALASRLHRLADQLDGE